MATDLLTGESVPDPEPVSTAGGVARSFGQGLTFNFSDEAEAAVRSLFGDETYQQELAQVRDEIEQFKQENPKLAAGSEIGGAVLGALVPGTAVARGATLASRIGRGILAGAGTGAVAGAGGGEGVQGRLLGAGTGAGLGAATGGVVPAAAGIAQKAVNRLRGKSGQFVPTTADIRAAKKRQYADFDNTDVSIKPAAFQRAANSALAKAEKEGFRPRLQKKAVVPLAEVGALAQRDTPIKLQELELLRRVLGAARKEVGTDDARIAGIVTDKLDDFVDRLKPADLVAGQGAKTVAKSRLAVESLKAARRLHRRQLKSEMLDGMIERAENKATAQGSRQGLDLNLRHEFLNLANQFTRKKRVKNMFTPAERSLVQRAARGTRPENVFTRLGRTFAPTNPIGLMAGSGLGGAAGSMVAGPVGAAIGAGTLAGVGAGSRMLGNRLTRANVQTAEDFIRSAGRVGPQPAANPQLEAILNAIAIGGTSRSVPEF